MKRILRNGILSASIVASCVSCSRSSHLYYDYVQNGTSTFVGNIWEHDWEVVPGSCSIIQVRVPCDAFGNEAHNPGIKVARWRTYTDVKIGVHYFCFQGPAWAVGAVAGSLLAAVTAAFLFFTNRKGERDSNDKAPT